MIAEMADLGAPGAPRLPASTPLRAFRGIVARTMRRLAYLPALVLAACTGGAPVDIAPAATAPAEDDETLIDAMDVADLVQRALGGTS